MARAPIFKAVLQIYQAFAQLKQLPMCIGSSVDMFHRRVVLGRKAWVRPQPLRGYVQAVACQDGDHFVVKRWGKQSVLQVMQVALIAGMFG